MRHVRQPLYETNCCHIGCSPLEPPGRSVLAAWFPVIRTCRGSEVCAVSAHTCAIVSQCAVHLAEPHFLVGRQVGGAIPIPLWARCIPPHPIPLVQRPACAPTPQPPPCVTFRRYNFFTGPWTATRSSLRMLRRAAAACVPCGVVSALPQPSICPTQSVHLDAPGQRHGQQPVSRTADPPSSQTGQVIQGLR